MFVRATQGVPVGYEVATRRLTCLAAGGGLERLSDDAYSTVLSELITRVRPDGGLPAQSRQVQVGVLEPREVGGGTRLALRWWTTSLGGRLFPALDADLDLCRVARDTSALRITARYEPPIGCHGQKIDRWALYGAANSTVRHLLRHLAETLAEPVEVEPSRRGAP